MMGSGKSRFCPDKRPTLQWGTYLLPFVENDLPQSTRKSKQNYTITYRQTARFRRFYSPPFYSFVKRIFFCNVISLLRSGMWLLYFLEQCLYDVWTKRFAWRTSALAYSIVVIQIVFDSLIINPRIKTLHEDVFPSSFYLQSDRNLLMIFFTHRAFS